MKAVWLLFLAHLGALMFALGGLLIALPHPELWAGNPRAAQVFTFGMRYGGTLHILLGAAAMLALGIVALGLRRTLIFLALATTLSLGIELLGTGTGWPFGAYAYTDGLGTKVLGRVPYTIPLSWFYVGLAAYLLASALVVWRGLRWPTLGAVLLGVWFLTVWDLALDPAMAHPDLAVRFWVWHETGPYFGMPVKNFAGWSLTGLLFIALSRLAWRRNADPAEFPVPVPFGIYGANIVFAAALSLSVGLWQPPLAALVLGIIPAALALRGTPVTGTPPSKGLTHRIAPTAIQQIARLIAARRLQIQVEGHAHVPTSGPVLIVARHYHHLYDGCALIATILRPVRILVALDWLQQPLARRVIDWACATAQWPVIVRDDSPALMASGDVRRTLRRAVDQTVALLRAGELVVIFPEGYPNIDPHYTPKRSTDEFLPFRPGFAALAQLAARDGHTQVPIIPTGLAYQPGRPWQVTLRFGTPLFLNEWPDRDALVRAVEAEVRQLSAPATAAQPAHTEEALQP